MRGRTAYRSTAPGKAARLVGQPQILGRRTGLIEHVGGIPLRGYQYPPMQPHGLERHLLAQISLTEHEQPLLINGMVK
jgi:hypothetical protein